MRRRHSPTVRQRVWGTASKPYSERASSVSMCVENSRPSAICILNTMMSSLREAATRGVLLAHGAGGGVARVGQQLLAAPGAPLIQLLEHGAGHVDLAADNQPRRKGAAQALRQAAHGAQVLRHVLAGDAVAAGGAADENAVSYSRDMERPSILGSTQYSRPSGRARACARQRP